MAMFEVSTTARHVVSCADKESLDTLGLTFQLGVIDKQISPLFTIDFLYIYKNTSALPNRQFILRERLRAAVERLLDYYPHLTGRFQQNAETQDCEIGKFDTGVVLVEAACNSTLDDIAALNKRSGRILLENLPNGGLALLPETEATLEAFYRDPIMTVQHTRFDCGGVVLGIRLYHIVCDGRGFFQLTRDLAEIYRQLRDQTGEGRFFQPCLAYPPVIDLYLSEPNALSLAERSEALNYSQSQWVLSNTMDDNNSKASGSIKQSKPQTRVIGRMLRFSGCHLQMLKKRATNPNGVEWISTSEALSAYLMQIIYRARLYVLKAQGLSTIDSAAQIYRGFWSPIDVRGSSGLSLPSRYFGNAVFCPYTQLPHDLLADGPLWEVAQAIHNVMRAPSGKYIEQSIKWYFAQPDKSRVRLDYNFGQGSFLVTHTTKFDIYDGVDFEKDQNGNAVTPIFVTSPYNKFDLADGVAKVRSTEEQLLKTATKGQLGQAPSVDVYLSLIEPLWEVLDQDNNFIELYA
jgi:hypothetical protein